MHRAAGSRHEPFAATPFYYLTDLGTASGSGNSYGYAVATVNGKAEVTGRTGGSSLPITGDPAIWSGGTATDLLSTVSGATAGTFLGMDSAGDAAGRAIIGGNKLAFYLPAGGATATVLPVLDSSSPYGAAYGVSNNGIVAGYSTLTDAYNNYHACVWTTAGTVTDIGGLVSNSGSYVFGASANGTYLTGYGYPFAGNDSGSGGYVPTVWTNTGSGWTCANVNPNPTSNNGGCAGEAEAYAVNDNGDAVGTGYRFGGISLNQNAFLFQANGTVVYLGSLGAGIPNDTARAINDSDVIVGNAENSGSVNHAFVWTSAGGMQDLNNMLATNAPSGWTLTYAYGIDNPGHITGYGTNSSGATHAFLLTPALPGDANEDGRVDINDLTIVLGNYGASGASWTQGDFNGDGKVDINDLTIVLGNYGATASSAAPARARCRSRAAWRCWPQAWSVC